MPARTSESRAAERANAQYDRAIQSNIERNRKVRRDMRDITKRVTESPALPGDMTRNGADERKSRKQRDTLERHKPNATYVLSDTAIKQGDKVVAIRRSSSKLIVRNADGTPDDATTLALASLWNTHRASGGR